MTLIDWYQITRGALQSSLESVVIFLPRLLGSLVVLIVGWLAAFWLARLVDNFLIRLKVNLFFQKENWQEVLAKAGIKLNVSNVISEIVRWIVFTAFLLAAVEILGYSQFAVFIAQILNYFGKVVVAVMIFVVTAVFSDLLSKIMVVMVGAAKISHAHIVGKIIKGAIWFFAIFAILHQLEIAQSLVDILFTGVVATAVIILGLSFGLAGKDEAAEIIGDLKRKLKS